MMHTVIVRNRRVAVVSGGASIRVEREALVGEAREKAVVY